MDETIFQQYTKHADILRNWFVAYGIGGIVLFLSSQSMFASIPKSELAWIAIFFFAGVLFQVILAFINKIYNFVLYHKKQPSESDQQVAGLKKNLLSFFLIDFPVDLGTFVAYALATYLLFNIVFRVAA